MSSCSSLIFKRGCITSELLVRCRDEGGQLEEDNARITSEIDIQKAGIEEAKAQVQYYEGHQRETAQKVRPLPPSTCVHR